MEYIKGILLLAYVVTTLALLIYGLNTCFLVYLFIRKKDEGQSENKAIEEAASAQFEDPENLPIVTTQIPLYNEINVAERVIRAVAGIDYPANRHQIQVLDDSTDETCAIVDAVVENLSQSGVWVEVVRRPNREGYKAGALAAGMEQAKGQYIAIFDSDFVPPADFLRRTLPHLWADPDCGMVQSRWDHLNQMESWLTRAQAVGIDGHFIIEQTARCRNGLFMNFCGTAGVWRREAIEDAGGWTHDTVTEDLDLSYRAQLRGWRFHYLPDLLVPAELPPTYSAFKSQQYRWAKGTIQTARKLLPTVWSAPIPLLKKFQATIHLTHYSLHLEMAVLALLILPLMLCYPDGIALYKSFLFIALLIPAAMGPSLGYLVCQYYGHPKDWKRRIIRLPFLLLVGFGICLSNAKAVLEGLVGNDTTFVRTPKRGEKPVKTYALNRNWVPRFEIMFSVYSVITILVLALISQYSLIPFVVVYTLGFGLVGISSLREARI